MIWTRAILMVVIGCVLGGATGFPVHGQSTPPKIDVATLGPQIGETVADFRLPDQRGTARSLDSLMGPRGLMLVFSRSADWCPYCKTQIIELQSRLSALEDEGLGVAVITYDTPAVLAEFSERRGITFPLLSDQGSATIKTYGILNTTADPATRNFGIPFPGTFLVNRQRVVTARFFEEAYQERNTVASILLKLGSSGHEVQAQRITTDHVEITTYVSDEVVAPGTLFSVVADVTPRSGMHVYAPGRHSYRVIDLRLESQPFLLTRPTQYPTSEIYHFAPLDERVEVYQKPFRLIQDLSLSTAADARKALASVTELTIIGTLEYQACDASSCFLPKRVPLSYTVSVRELDSQRANVPAPSR